MATANPALRDTTFERFESAARTDERSMTAGGTALKTAGLVLIAVAAGVLPWQQYASAQAPETLTPYLIVGLGGGLVLALVTIFKPRVAPWTAPVYAALEGLALGALTALAETAYPGIAVQAAGLTVATLAVMLGVYASGVITVTHKFRMGVVAATGGVVVLYVVSFVLAAFGVSVPFIHEGGWLAIGVSAVIIVIAALNLVLDFDLIQTGVEQRAPKAMEWYGAFALMVTLVWIYVEFLRLLSYLAEE